MDFVRSYFGTNELLTSWTLFSSLFDWFAMWPVKKCGKKCSTGQRFICTKVTSYKIHILVAPVVTVRLKSAPIKMLYIKTHFGWKNCFRKAQKVDLLTRFCQKFLSFDWNIHWYLKILVQKKNEKAQLFLKHIGLQYEN